MSKIVLIVDDNDEIIGKKQHQECLLDDITRVTGLFLYTPEGKVLVAKRVMTKGYDPGKWSFAVAGTVESHETYLDNILKETEEEIGLTLQAEEIREVFHGLFKTTHQFFYRQYVVERAVVLDELKLQEDEVAELRLLPAQELFDWIQSRPEDFVDSLPQIVKIVRQTLKW